METITRIHIARTPYDIEVAAKTRLEKYLDAVRKALDADTADDVMNDIEARITELLAERKVATGGVITAADVRFVEEQLGEPGQFGDETKSAETAPARPRRLLRDLDNAMLGGVASGLGLYFNIDPLIFRLIFVLLTFAGGAGVFLYLLCWLLVPPAASNAEKLQMQGKAVTAANLQHYRQTMTRTLRWSRTASGRIILAAIKITVTSFAVAMLLSIATSATLVTSTLFTQPLRPIVWSYHTNAFALGAFWLFALSLIVLLGLLIRQLWRHTFPTAIKVTFLSTLAMAVISMITLVGLTPVIGNHYNSLYGNGKLTTALPVGVEVPATSITKLSIASDHNLDLTYVVASGPIHATYQSKPGMRHPNITITANGDTLSVDSVNLASTMPDCLVRNICRDIYLPVHVTLYGPAVQSITTANGADVETSGLSGALTVLAANNAFVTLDNSSLTQVDINASGNATVSASGASAQTANITVDKTSTIFAPVVTTLNATTPTDTCNNLSSSPQPLIFLSNTPATVTVNGQAASGAPQDLGSRCVSNGLISNTNQ